jgi:CubicO group peptidase (beta-lactamase class C family)
MRKALIIYSTFIAAMVVWVAGAALPGADAAAAGADIDVPRVDGPLAKRIDRFVGGLSEPSFDGSVLIATNGQVILHKGYGWADDSHDRLTVPTTPFWIASISKQFAAAAILVLKEDGKLALQDPISVYFAGVPRDKQAITIHQLLTHTAGLGMNYAADGITDRGEAVRAILAEPLAREPGGAYGYSNDGYNLLAAIVEVASGTAYERFVRDELLTPAGLANTGFWGPAGHPQVAAIRADQFPDSSIARPNWGFRGATGMYSTTGDLYRWYLALKSGAALPKEDAARLATPYTKRGGGSETGVGYGWFVSPTARGTECVWTRGYEDFGQGAVLAVYPQERVVIAVTSRSGAYDDGYPVSHRLAKQLEQMVFEPR